MIGEHSSFEIRKSKFLPKYPPVYTTKTKSSRIMKFNSQIKSLTLGATATVITALGMLSGSVQAAILSGTVSLADLFVAGNIYRIGDKDFTNFRDFLSNSTGGADTISIGDIFVTGVQDDPLSYRLIFQSGLLDVVGNQTISASFAYDVTATNPTLQIAGAGIELTGAAARPPGSIVVTDTFTLPDSTTRTASDTIGTPNLNPTSVAFGVPGLTTLSVRKDLVLSGNDTSGEASISFLDQTTFYGLCGSGCISIPEPSQVPGLVTLGGLGLMVIGKKLKLKITNVNEIK